MLVLFLIMEEKTAEKIIRGSSAAVGAWLTWWFYKEKSKPQAQKDEEKRKRKEDWENGGRKGCFKIIICIILFFALLEWGANCSEERRIKEIRQKHSNY